MSHSFVPETWNLSKPAVTGQQGLVASHHYLASEIGANILANGGNAVDAAVAASAAIGAVEPWMSGIGGGGFMLIHQAHENKTYAIDFGMRAPQALNPEDYPLAEGVGTDLFQWPAVV
ncbi:MAG: gamma-glutamyltransferase, partial [Candidatus Competibacteraceae bacterium]|nr:gamma-glutamyltransferase [Candidatus Competibacteraceae bacterium]